MELFFVRQAIYDKNEKVFAYELIFDSLNDGKIYDKDLEEKKVKFVCNYGAIGLNKFTNNKKALVGFTSMSILEDIPDLFGKDCVMIQLTKNNIFSKEILDSIEELKNKGYIIVFNIESKDDDIELISKYIDIYKVSFSNYTEDEIKDTITILEKINPKAKLFANNISCKEQYDFAIKSGFSYFSGEYFSKPIIISNKEIDIKNSNRFNIIIELLNDDFDIEKIVHIIKCDLAISYKLIRFLNSPVFGFVQSINSIRQGIMLLGKEELRKWLTLVVISDMSVNNNEEIINTIIVRARFCELLAEKIALQKKSRAFMVGLFSELDYFTNREMKEITEEISLEEEVKEALLGKENILSDILKLVKACEKMRVKELEKYTKILNVNKKMMFELYSQSIEWLGDSNLNFNK